MRRLLVSVVLAGCVSAPAPKPATVEKEAPPALPTAAECPKALPATSGDPAALLGARIEKVCLVGSNDDTHLRLSELVAPREGTPLDRQAVSADLEALFALGMVNEATAVAQPLASKGVVLTYFVTLYPWANRVRLEGVTATLPGDDLDELTSGGRVASPLSLRALANGLTALYAREGFKDAKVDVSTERIDDQLVLIVAKVTEGARATVTAVRFEGIKQVPESQLRKVLRTTVGAPVQGDVVNRDALQLTGVYLDRGLVNAVVEPDLRALPQPGATEVVFVVKEGDVFKLGKLSLTGLSLGVEKELLQSFESKPGSIFNRSALARDIERLRARAKQKHQTVNITPITNVDSEAHRIDLKLEIEKLSVP